MAPPLLLLQDVRLDIGGEPLLDGAELAVAARDRLCLVGRNGSGKSTLLKIAAGMVEPDGGTRFLQPSTTIRYLPQEPDLSGFNTTLAFVEAGLASGDDPHRARLLLEALGLTGDEAASRLSGGESRRAALARVLAPEPDILLLDEPTNHLDLVAIEALESMLGELRSAIVLISHDRRFLETLSRATVWLDRGTTRRLDRGFADFETWRDAVLEEEERDRHKLDRQIAREEDWLRYGVTARRKRNQGRLRALNDLRRDRREARARQPTGSVTMSTQEARQSGKLVIEAEEIVKSYDHRPIVRALSIRIERGDRIGIVGPNGAGKTTLVNLLTDVLSPDSGEVRLGANVELATLDQRRESLDPEATVAEVLTDGRGDTVIVGGEARHVVGYMKDFLFRPDQARAPVKALSGGERGRLMLARALARPSNLLVLDEPTNDLDLETLDLLQEMLADLPGTLILVSHDRDFLDRIVTATLASDGDGEWTLYAGGYSDMVAQRGHGIGGRARPDTGRDRSAPKEDTTPKPRAKSKQRLSFNDQHALKTLPGRIAELTKDVRRHEETLADPDLYARDPDAFAGATKALTTAQESLAEAEDEWLRIELLRESIEET
ncbi:MAG: ATP-binding cassette domain-containing protein [Bauldia sp.]|uniref:ABC-F family ATP-binding cassette domain-containing protein n=1 Tax=Bauldia sp. TaxID=2575872 RepID=UPI001D55897B|nr:ATP-binding cassette domain-containing protein [Bauldia sp.]MCB1495997.1 ATP-binding cassette domain-containing protein [Bauldia sp.]